jgi:pimeloyl-ACP methyl ester carboxylesterase
MRIDRVVSADGAPVEVHTTGAGPSIVLLHDGGVPQARYHELAEALEHRFTVSLYGRRGLPGSAPSNGDKSTVTDLADLSAVLAHTGARSLFGHGGGGFLALRTALALPLDRVAVYDPMLSVLGRPDWDFVDEFEHAVQAGDHARALTVLDRGTSPDGPAAKVPFNLALLLTRARLRTPGGRAMAELLPTLPPELRRIRDHDGPADDYAGISAEVLLAAGARSAEHYAENCRALAEVVPRGQALIVPGAAHDAATLAHNEFVRPISRFLAGSA